MNKKKKIIIAVFAFILLLGGIFIAKKAMGPKVEFTKMNNGHYKEEGTDLFDVFIGTEEDPSEIVFKVNDSKLSYKLPFEVNLKQGENGEVKAGEGNKAFRYNFVKENKKIVGLKSELILNKKPNHNVFTFPMKTESITRTRKVSSRDFYDKNNNLVFYMEKPSMTDQKENKSEDINLRITNSQIALVPSKEWLEKEEREYPVIIDFSFKVADSIIEEKTKD